MRNQKSINRYFFSHCIIDNDWKYYYLAYKDRTLNFSFQADTYKDGGTKVYIGLGYKVID